MSLWYKGFRCLGNSDVVLDNLISTVQTEKLRTYNLPKFVQTAYVEKRSQKQSGEFYLFLGLNSSVPGTVPKEVGDTLLKLPDFCSPLSKKYYIEEEIRPMCAPKDDLSGRVAYWKPTVLPETDPFEQDVEDFSSTDADEERSRKYDRLLFWLSAVGFWQMG